MFTAGAMHCWFTSLCTPSSAVVLFFNILFQKFYCKKEPCNDVSQNQSKNAFFVQSRNRCTAMQCLLLRIKH